MTEKLLYVAAANFEAARSVDCLKDDHRARRLHGHGFLGEVRASLSSNWAKFPGAEISQLKQKLDECVAPLDYSHLNNTLPLPTDENLARWIRSQLNAPGIQFVGVQSTQDQGVDLDLSDRAHVWRRYTFQSAHQLPNVPLGHKCGRMHGHGFEVLLHAAQSIKSSDISIDYDFLDEMWAPLHTQLDHACLNEIPGLENPTSENISAWIWEKLKPTLPDLSWVTVYETASCGAHFDGTHYRIWKEFTLDSAVQLKRAPEGDVRSRIHGHTFTLRLHLHAPLDQVKGWTLDFGDIKEIFDPIFKQLDHQPLHELMGQEDSDTASIARKIKALAYPMIPALDRIDLNESRGCGVILSWGQLGPALPV